MAIDPRADLQADLQAAGLYHDALWALPAGVVMVDAAGHLLDINPSGEHLLGVDKQAWMNDTGYRSSWKVTYPGGAVCPPHKWPLSLCLGDGQARADMVVGIERPDGSQIWISISALPLFRNGESRPYSAVGTFSELPSQGDLQPALPALTHDSLTRLQNRTSFRTKLERVLSVTAAPRFAVYCLELNHFRLVNSTLGHSVGDALLQQVAERLRAHATQATELARFGGDEFMLLWPGIGTEEEADQGGQALQELFSLPFQVNEHEVFLGVSVGISLCPRDGLDGGTLLGRAESGAWKAKTTGRQAVEQSASLLSVRLSEQWKLEAELRRALALDQISVLYQPITAAVSGQVVAAEALVRWTHPTLGQVPPTRFIPVAEDTGLIHELGGWVMRRACNDACSWPQNVRVAVNVSALQFERPDFLAGVEAALQESGLHPERLELELTESAVMRDPALTAAHIRSLRDLGVRVTIDDFGTGYSSLGVLKTMPLSALKMDRSFVSDLEREPQQQPLIRAIVELGHALGLQVVAEGIENPAQRAILTALGCDLLQGYGIARPSADPGRTGLSRADPAQAGSANLRAEAAPASSFTGSPSEPSEMDDMFYPPRADNARTK